MGLANLQWVEVQEVDRLLAADSVFLRARGFPHGWLVVQPQPLVPTLTAKRVAGRNLLKSCFFWLAFASVTVCAVSAASRPQGRFDPLWRGTTGLRAFVSLATGSAAAGYVHLIAPGVDAPLLTLGTCLALLGPIHLIRSPGDLQRHWRLTVLTFLVSLVIVASSLGTLFAAPVIPFLVLFLIASLAVALACLYSLTFTIRESSPDPSLQRTPPGHSPGQRR